MREIIFKGKRKDTGEWIEGDLLRLNKHVMIAPHDGDWYDFMPPVASLGLPRGKYEVDPETVSQYTGLKDKNDKRIFENHIVTDDTFIRKISMKNPYWYQNLHMNLRESEIVGNIFDNPELLKP